MEYRIINRYKLILWSVLCFGITKNYAIEPLPASLIALESPDGLRFLKKDLKQNGLNLLTHFTTQKTGTYCGVASLVMVLNSLHVPPPLDAAHKPYHYFTQDNFFNENIKKIIVRQEVETQGMTLAQMSQVLQSYGLKVTSYRADNMNAITFKKVLIQALRQKKYIIVNFLRTALQQEGGGHHSPVAAYDERHDRFLILDVARYKYPSFWVTSGDLWRAVHTQDHHTFRGVIIISVL